MRNFNNKDESGKPLPQPTEEVEPVDFEDRGEKGFNYKSERFSNRLQNNSDISKVFSSKVHGNPSTPILEAYPSDYLYRSSIIKWDIESGMWGILRIKEDKN